MLTFFQMSMPGDITFGSGTTYFGTNLTAYVLNGTIPLSRVDDMATRILASWYFLHQDSPSYPAVNFNAFYPDDDATNSRLEVEDDHHTLVREIGAASTVLLKNVGGALPLRNTRTIVLIGSDAGTGTIGPNAFADQGGVDVSRHDCYLLPPFHNVPRGHLRWVGAVGTYTRCCDFEDSDVSSTTELRILLTESLYVGFAFGSRVVLHGI